MKILILGGNGMLGHKLFLHFKIKNQVKVTLRKTLEDYSNLDLYTKENIYENCDVRDFQRVKEVIEEFSPQIVINGIGITHHGRNTETKLSIEVNALLPHQVAEFCKDIGARFIQISTDCIFDGQRGGYEQNEKPNNTELYGMTKFLGEVHYPNTITLRTSIIGLEIDHKSSLIEWFLSQKGDVKGFQKAIFSGLTTAELARVIEDIIENHSELSGVWQIASRPISKFDILKTMKDRLNLTDVQIVPETSFVCDRSLKGESFSKQTGYIAPSWEQMLTELSQEVTKREQK